MASSPYKQVPGDQNTNVAGAEIARVTATTATAGANGSLPATVKGYIVFELSDGSVAKVPYYLN